MKTIIKIFCAVSAFFLCTQLQLVADQLTPESGCNHINGPDILNFTGEDIAVAIRTANAPALAKYFNTSLDLSIPGNDITCSKTQAEQIIRDFFAKNPPKSFKINHQGSSKDGSQFFIGTYISTKGKSFRTYFLMKKVSEVQYIQQLQFEEE